jgi:O-methyltransferase
MQRADPLAEPYLELMKKALSYSLWQEPGVPLEVIDYGGPILKRIVRAALRLLRRANLQLVRLPVDDPELRAQGYSWPAQAHTMIGTKRLDNLRSCIESVLDEGVPGDLIETGAWRGGACIFMRAVLLAHGVRDRRVFVADSFRGLPAPDPERYPADAGDIHHKIGLTSVSRQEVEQNFRSYGLLDEQVVFLEGWFEDSLPKAPIGSLAVLRLDGDMYESTIQVLDLLYPKLSPGGWCIVDDYALAGCRRAVDDYRARHGVDEAIRRIDWTGVYWRKRPRDEG